MAALFLILLVVAWVVIYLPAATRARARGPIESTVLFRQGLDHIGADGHAEFVRTLGRPAPRLISSPPGAAFVGEAEVRAHVLDAPRPTQAMTSSTTVRPSEIQFVINRVRTLVLGILVVCVIASAGVAVLRGAWELHLAVDALLAIYVSWLLEEKHRRSERRRKVRYLQSARRARPVEPLRAAAGER